MQIKPTSVFVAVAAAFAVNIGIGYAAEPIASPIIADGSEQGEAVKTITETDILIDVTEGSDAVLATKAGKVHIGDENTQTVIIKSGASVGDAVSAFTPDGKDGKDNLVEIKAKESVEIHSQKVGIWAQSNTQVAETPANSATVNIEANRISINAVEQAVIAFSNSRVNLTAKDITITSEKGVAIETRGNSIVNVGSADSTIVVKGDIVFATSATKSGNLLNSTVNLELNGEDSSWTGSVQKYYPSNLSGSDTKVEGFNLTIANGAQWTVTDKQDGLYQSETLTHEQGSVNTLTLNNGVITTTSDEQEVKVDSLKGTDGTVHLATKLVDDEFTVAKFSVGNESATDTKLTAQLSGITADDVTDANVAAEAIANAVNYGGEKQGIVAEGNLKGAITTTIDAEGKVVEGSTKQVENTKLSSYSSINAMSLVQWRNEINHLTKRLGDIRASESTIGAWARVYGGSSEWGSNPEVDMDHTTIQVGGDYRVNPNWIVGAAFSYTDSDAESSNGFADGESYSLAAYATYLADNGSFLDMIARYGYLKNDITAGNMALETKNNAFSLSVEGGHQFRFIEDRAYIEPQIELTYGFVAGDDSNASNGVRIEQDDYQNLITRVGVRAGFDFPEKAGTFYATLSYSYDFLGDADGTASNSTAGSVALTEDLGGGWVTYGVGAQFRLGDNAFAYGELERTSGGDIDNPYLFNVGLRWNF